jgi:mRNA-degrading endonuclease HigB of HigAB toxin-antitoxin module
MTSTQYLNYIAHNCNADLALVAWENEELAADVDEDEEPFTEPNQIKLSWPLEDDTGLEEHHVLTIEAAEQVTVVDRAFQPADVVCNAAQSGTVSTVALLLDLAIYSSPLDDLAALTKKITSKYGPKKSRDVTVFNEISSRDVRPITVEDSCHVALSHQGSNWVGKIDGGKLVNIAFFGMCDISTDTCHQ